MIYQNLYTINGNIFAKSFERVVHGGQGDYIELTYDQIIPELLYKFDKSKFNINNVDKDIDIFYYWLCPKDEYNIKVYYQLGSVDYADYKVGKFYISPDLIKDFKDPDKINCKKLF